jgi:hypothetical protein
MKPIKRNSRKTNHSMVSFVVAAKPAKKYHKLLGDINADDSARVVQQARTLKKRQTR